MPYEALELDTMEGGPAIQDLLAGKLITVVNPLSLLCFDIVACI
jgi:hypothetical protein